MRERLEQMYKDFVGGDPVDMKDQDLIIQLLEFLTEKIEVLDGSRLY